MIKILYLLAGIMLKQTVDEIKALLVEYGENLKRRREAIATYRPVPALMEGTAEAMRAVNEARHEERMRPYVDRLSTRILIVRLVPGILYALSTVGLFVWIAVLECSS